MREPKPTGSLSRRRRADLAIFHEFAPAPSGGGNQFMRALSGELASRGYELEVNRLSGSTPVCLFNSFNFDFRRLRRFARDGCRMVHRVDGPIGVYRGFDDGTDARISELNRELAGDDGVSVPLQPREAPRARARAPRPGSDQERRRSRDLPSAREARPARGPQGAPDLHELVGKPAQGRRASSRGSTGISTGLATR